MGGSEKEGREEEGVTWLSAVFYAAVIFVASLAWAVTKKFYALLEQIELELRQANEYLKANKDHLERISQNTPDPMFWIDIQQGLQAGQNAEGKKSKQ